MHCLKAHSGFPFGTFVVNLSGCLLIGLLMVSIVEMWRPHRLIRPFLGVGLLGGYTTFSTYAIETQRLIQAGDARIAFIYFVATLLGALLAVQAGVLLYAFRERCFRGGEDDLARPGVPAHHPSG